MSVEVDDFYQGYDAGWNWTCLSRKERLSDRCHARLIRDALYHFEGFGIDFTQYAAPVVMLRDNISAEIRWKHKKSGKELCLSEVWFDRKTGAINQCGRNYGNLVS